MNLPLSSAKTVELFNKIMKHPVLAVGLVSVAPVMSGFVAPVIDLSFKQGLSTYFIVLALTVLVLISKDT